MPTAVPTETPPPQPTPTLPNLNSNLLPNPSFELGWYHPGGIPELQIPNQWRFEWDEGENPLDPDPWNNFVRPEVRVLPGDLLPIYEHDLFIWNGNYTLKVFKREGSISFRLLTEVALPAGSYEFEIQLFPDLVTDYDANGDKIWAPDPLSGEVRLIVGGASGIWMLPVFGQKNTFVHSFDLPSYSGQVLIGVAIRGRWAILNNGWFLDNWTLRRVGGG